MDDSESLEVRWVQGFTSSQAVFLDEETACYPCGSSIIFFNVETHTRKVLQSPGHGIGVFTANGFCRILAFSEQKHSPSIFVYRYPELSLICELKDKAELSYTALALSDTAPYLASCSSLPDYTITVWDLEKRISICCSRLSEEDVTSLHFSPMSWQQICSLNPKSLIVWNIEKCNEFHIMKPSVIDLPTIDGSAVEQINDSYTPPAKLKYSGPQMPTSTITGLIGDKADYIVHLKEVKPQLCPSVICWSVSSNLYVGTKEGFLLLVNTESLLVCILHNPHIKQSTSECSKSLVIQEGSFQCLALSSKGMFTTGSDGVLQIFQIKENEVEVEESLALVEPVSSLCFSPDCKTLLLTSPTGRMYKYNPGPANEVIKVLDVLCGNFIGAVPVYTEKNFCVSVRESGELQLWSLQDGDCIASLFLHTKVTCLACCPKAQYVAIGAVTGHILFVDLTRAQNPRLVHTVRVYHVPVEHLVFDQGANFLITAALNSHIFFLDARPSKAFKIIGYTEVMGATMSLSTQYQQENKKVDVLVLCNNKMTNKTSNEQKEGNLLMLLSLSTQQILGTANCVDPLGLLQEQAVQSCVYEIPHSLSSCVLGTKTVFGYCPRKKVLQKFKLPQDVDKLCNEKGVGLSPEKEVQGHSLGPALLHLSPNQSWLASVGRDGLLLVHDVATLEKCVQKQFHSWWLAGIRSVCFTPDSQTLITTGLRDGSLVCSSLSLKIAGVTQSDLSVGINFDNEISQENPILSDMTDWVPPSQTPMGFSPSPTIEVINREQVKSDPDKKESSDSRSNPTWLDNKLNAVLKEESQQFAETRRSLINSVQELRNTIKSMMQENEKLPDIEKLEQLEFNLDMEERQRLHDEGKQEVSKVRKEIELENLARCYLHDILKKKYWDSMTVKEKAIKAFNSEQEVANFPMKERTAKELEELYNVECIRKTEQADSSQDVLENSKEVTEDNKDEENKKHKEESLALTGSLSTQCGLSNPHLYSQFSLQTMDLKIKQIVLLKDVIYQVKIAFNKEFEAVYKQKEQEINRIKDKNRRITEIMNKLELQETLWEPILTDSERPERALTVEDSEIKVEKYLTLEQRQREKEQSNEVEQRRLEAKGDNIRGRALDDMMGGVLEVKKDDILQTELTPPEFIEKPEIEWTEEERRIYKEHQRHVKELNEEQEKYKKTLEAEMKKLQASIKDSSQAFDETLSKLFEKKVKSEMILYQEELKITNLSYSLLIEEEMLSREEELIYLMEKAQTVKNHIGKSLKNHSEDKEHFQETYDNTVAEDRLLDSGFRKEFSDVPGHIVDQLYKLYKRRPRIQIIRTQTDKLDSYKETSIVPNRAADAPSQMMKAMEELDAPQNMPEGLDPSVWERFCLSRRTKVDSEQKVKMKAQILAEVQEFLKKRRHEDENAQMEIMNLSDNLNSLRKERSRLCLDVMLQILLKQGQVEVKTKDFTADYSDSLLIQRSVVEELNNSIRALGVQKLASMIECKDFHKGIIQQEWEHKRMSKQIEDLRNKARDIQMLHVSQELQEYLRETDHENRMTKKVSALEKTITLQEKNFTKSVKSCKKLIKELNRQAEVKNENNAALDLQLNNLQMTVAEIRNIYETSAMEKTQESEAKQRYQNILQRKKLADLAKAQEMDIAILNSELECKRMKSFPAFPQ